MGQLPNNSPATGRPQIGKLQGGVLVVDDDASVREVTRMGLEAMGCKVFATGDGAEGVEMYRSHKDEIDVAIIDVEMPGMSGHEVFHALESINPAIKAVMTSGYGEEDMMDKFPGSKPVGFLGKPYRIHELHTVMRSVLESTGNS